MYSFCPKCGGRLEQRQVEGVTRLVCSSCAFVFYQNPTPAAAVIALRDGKVVLVRRGIEPKKGGLDFPGGFLEEWEDAEDAAVREFSEETGLSCAGLRLLCVVPVRYVVPGYERNVLAVYFVSEEVTGMPKPGDDALEVLFKPLSELREEDLVLDDNKKAFKQFKETKVF